MSYPLFSHHPSHQGVSSKKQQYYGGSAAQSTLFPALDAALEVSHSAHSSNVFLLEMRNYMPPGSFVRSFVRLVHVITTNLYLHDNHT